MYNIEIRPIYGPRPYIPLPKKGKIIAETELETSILTGLTYTGVTRFGTDFALKKQDTLPKQEWHGFKIPDPKKFKKIISLLNKGGCDAHTKEEAIQTIQNEDIPILSSDDGDDLLDDAKRGRFAYGCRQVPQHNPPGYYDDEQ